MSIKAWVTLAIGAPFLGACQSAPEESAAGSSNEPAPLQTSQGQTAPKVGPSVEQRARVALAQAGVKDELKLLTLDAVEWTDSSLGCRQPGQQYLQAITKGHLLQFGTGEPGAPVYHVHVAGETAIVCSNAPGTGLLQRPPRASRAFGLDVIAVDARKDLAERLGLRLENVELHKVSPVTFGDNQLDCGAPPGDEPAPPVRGHRLLFQTASGNFVYHTDGKRFAPCPPISAE